MLRSTIAFVLLASISWSISSQELKLVVNTDNAIETFNFLNSSDHRDEDALRILQLEGTRGMLKHDSIFDKEVTRKNFLAEIENDRANTNAFRFREIRKQLAPIATTINFLNDSLLQISKQVSDNLRPYLPLTTLDPINVFFILGGNSDGYSMDNTSFFLEIQFYHMDPGGLTLLMTHEILHVLQERFQQEPAKVSKNKRPSFELLKEIFMEGSASYIANPLAVDSPGQYVQFNIEKYKSNLKKLDDSFVLFEALLNWTIQNPDKDFDQVYNIGFGGQWDSPLYFVGYEICNQLERYFGRYHLKNYFNQPVTQFLVDYIALYHKRSGEKELIKFSRTTEKHIKLIHSELTR